MPFVVATKPGVDMDAADGSSHAFLFEKFKHLLDLCLREFVELAVIKRNVCFPAR